MTSKDYYMRSIFLRTMVFCLLAMAANGQLTPPSLLNVGDAAPPLRVREWLKGAPIREFQRDRVYVVEFWATWCGPCRLAMPHLSLVARKFGRTVTVIGVDIMERGISVNGLHGFVDSMGIVMDYPVAAEDSNFMTTGWFNAAGVAGIPAAFVVNQEGRLAWIGPPDSLEGILPKVLNDSLDLEKASAARISNMRWEALDGSAGNELREYRAELEKRDPGGMDSLLLKRVDEIVAKEPGLKYALNIAAVTFNTLLKTDPQKAYEYGKVLLVTPTYRIPPFYVIFNNIRSCSERQKLPPEIYELGAEAYQARIDYSPETVNLPNTYHIMADWYWRAHDTSKAIAAEEKAIMVLKTEKHPSVNSLAAFESCLQLYKKAERTY